LAIAWRAFASLFNERQEIPCEFVFTASRSMRRNLRGHGKKPLLVVFRETLD